MNITWAATRATGLVSLILLSIVAVLGIAYAGGWGSAKFPKLMTAGLHRRMSLLAVVFLFLHILTTVIDGYVPVSWLNVIVPFTSSYKTLWVGLAAISVDLLIAITVTSLLRNKINLKWWKYIHYLAYVAWVLALLHALGAGTDRGITQVIAGISVAVVMATALVRVYSLREARAW